MSLAPGSRVGPHEITGPLGEGGMGVVYRARDTRLDRDVAVKILPAAVAADPDRLARFEREAKTLASLNHPNIAQVHGLEESGGTPAMIMELVEGPTLADRLVSGALPVEEALGIARQVAEAVEAAHEQGIIHRDLKPANIKVRPDGTVKVLDFGLAKAFGRGSDDASLANSPTLTARATQAGIIMGTAAYMSPEQAKGKPVDRRADIWSFGVVLFEMLVGRQLYTGETASEIMAHVITRTPDLGVLPPGTPPRVRTLLQRCLARDPKQRLSWIGEARLVIDEVLAGGGVETASAGPAAPVAAPSSRGTGVLPWALAAALLVALPAVLVFSRRPVATERPFVVSDLPRPGVNATNFQQFAIAPDGSAVVFVARQPPGNPRLFIRPLNQAKAVALAETDGASNPFFSPDARWIAFFADGKLKKVAAAGGGALTLCDAINNRGGAWAEDDTIVFAAGNREGLSRVSAAGGAPVKLTTLDAKAGEITHRNPFVLPGARAIIYEAHSSGSDFDTATIVAQPLPDGPRRILVRNSMRAWYDPAGYLLYVHSGTLFAVRFDAERLALQGEAVPVFEQVAYANGNGVAQFEIARNGTAVAFQSAPAEASQIDWLLPDGKFQPMRRGARGYAEPAFSPNGSRVAMVVTDGGADEIWVLDSARHTLSRLTFGPGAKSFPAWTPDGRRIAYVSEQAPRGIAWTAADGGGKAEPLWLAAATDLNVRGLSWHPSGRYLAFSKVSTDKSASADIWVLPVDGNEKTGWKAGTPVPFANEPYAESTPAFSPDGRWMAYTSSETGGPQVFVRGFPGPGGKWQISVDGGSWPAWTATGHRLVFRNGTSLLDVTWSGDGGVFRASKPSVIRENATADVQWKVYAVHPDGRRMAVVRDPDVGGGTTLDRLTLLVNFSDEIRRRMPPVK